MRRPEGTGVNRLLDFNGTGENRFFFCVHADFKMEFNFSITPNFGFYYNDTPAIFFFGGG